MDGNNMKVAQETGHSPSRARNTSLLRIGVLFLALVSFFTTANGMRNYIFKVNGGVAYAASAAIQSILLALSMNLPKYLQGIWNSGNKDMNSYFENQRILETENNIPISKIKSREFIRTVKRLMNYLIRFFLCAIAVALTIVTTLCSSWFSYVYIADVIHKDSWDTDSELLVQQTYRIELYDARDYAHSYRIYLEERLGEDILKLERQAQTIADSNSRVEIDWNAEAAEYISNDETAASYMSPVIMAMEAAMEQDSSQESRDLAATAIANAKENVTNRKEEVQANLDSINANLANYNTQIANLRASINAATEETDVASLNASINRLAGLISSETERQISLQQESAQLDRALFRLPFYESLLGLSNSTSSISIRTQLIAMQSEFFKADPDDQVLLDIATRIFNNLRSAATTAANEGVGQDSFSYTNLLVQMNRLLQNLTDYSEVKAIEANLDRLIADLRAGSENDQNEHVNIEPNSENVASGENNTGSDIEGAASGQDESEVNLDESLIDQNGGNNTTTDGADGQNPENFEDKSSKGNEGTWQEEWYARIDALKAQISAMPVYSDMVDVDLEDSQNGENINVLTDSQLEVLRNYDRNSSNAALDDLLRRYVSEHNAVYQGIIYLMSPYRMLAIFALCLALSFDLSGFVFGVVMQGEPQRNENAGDQKDTQEDILPHWIGTTSRNAKSRSDQIEWSILDHLHPYRVLTGDFSHKGDTYCYRVFRDGLAEQWLVKDANVVIPYKQGIYVLEEDVAGRERDEEGGRTGVLVADTDRKAYTHQELCYSGQAGGPQDGVFVNCYLSYKEGGLSKQEPDGTWSFICSLEEYVPVHCYDPVEKENRTFPVRLLAQKKELSAKIAVVALNKSGTRVSALYVIKDN